MSTCILIIECYLSLDFEVLAEAIRRENESNLYTKNIALIKFDSAYRYIFNINVLRSRVEDYLFSQDSEKRFALIDDKRYWFGLSYYDKIADQFRKHSRDMRLIHNLVDQKTIMNNRLKYLANKEIIDNKQLHFLTKDNTTMLKKLVLLRNITIKNNIKYKGNWPLEMVDSFLKQLKEVKFFDARFCKELLEIIK